jgi:hypothetical protein
VGFWISSPAERRGKGKTGKRKTEDFGEGKREDGKTENGRRKIWGRRKGKTGKRKTEDLGEEKREDGKTENGRFGGREKGRRENGRGKREYPNCFRRHIKSPNLQIIQS